MASLTRDQVLHIAKLARITLTSKEVDKMTSELSSIVGYVDLLREVDTDAVEPTPQVTGLRNTFREDIVLPSQAPAEALLACSPLPTTERQIKAPHAHG